MNLSTSPQENGTDCRNVSRAAVQAVQTPTISARQGRSAWCGMGCAPALLTAVVLCCLMWVLPGLSTAAEDGGGKVFLWSFAAEKGTLYLLGSVHVLRPDVYPLDERIDRAVARVSADFTVQTMAERLGTIYARAARTAGRS